MTKITVLTSLICGLLAYHKADAQGFWYVPPGSDLSVRYGLDLGNGLGFGYGFGVGYGSAQSPEGAIEGALADQVQFQNRSNATVCGTVTRQHMSTGDGGSNSRQPNSEFVALKSALNGQSAKPRAEVSRPRRKQAIQTPLQTGTRLSDREYNRSTGEIFWPTVLLDDSFSAQRTKIESLLNMGPPTEVTREFVESIANSVQQMRQRLRTRFHSLPGKDYLEGHTFLTHLSLEGKLLLNAAPKPSEIPW